MLPLIPAWFLATTIALAIYVKLKQKHYEHAFTRVLLFGLYFVLASFPSMPIEMGRTFSRYFVELLFVIEIISFYFFKRGKRK